MNGSTLVAIAPWRPRRVGIVHDAPVDPAAARCWPAGPRRGGPGRAPVGRSLIADGTAPLGVRLALVGLLVWLVSPIDLIPEFIPVLGPLDDVVVAVLVLRYVRRRLGADELRRRWPGNEPGLALLLRLIG